MSGFGRSGSTQTYRGGGEMKNGTVSGIKVSPGDMSKKRVTVREKSARGQIFTVDIPAREARDLERKEAYSFRVEKKPAKSYGGAREKKTGLQAYDCHEAPQDYGSRDTSEFKTFESNSRFGKTKSKGKSRTKFQ